VSTPSTVAAPVTGAVATPSWRRSVGLLAVATIAIGVANYGTSLAAVHLLPAASFADYAAGQGLLLVLGTGSFAALPWAVARYLARSTEADAAQKAMHFGLTGSLLQAVVLAPIALIVCWSLAGPMFGLAGGLATIMISVLAGPVGFLQGRQQLSAIAALRSIETLGRIVATVVIIFALSRNAAAVLIAFPIGSALALVYALRRGREGFPMRRMSRTLAIELTRDAALLGAIQVLLAMLGALDTVYAAAGHFSTTDAASYQAAALLARIPLFFSAAISTAAYTDLAAAPDEHEAGRQIRSAMRTYLWLAAPFLIAYLTLPQRLLDLLIPAKYDQTLSSLRALCFAGVLVGMINVLTTAHQARGRFRTCITVLVGGVIVQAAALGWLGHAGHLHGFAVAASAVCAVTLAGLVYDGRHWLAGSLRRARPPRQLYPLVVATVVAALDHQPIVWIAMLAVVSVCAASAAFAHPAASAKTHAPPSQPASPGSTTPQIEESSR
jgi:O-antigen/teichoic acid export membrane protein